MSRRHYSSNARETSLTTGVTSSATTLSLDSPVGYPAETPFVVLCELGTSSEEIMLVTAMVGDQWTVVRGYDNSTAVAHDLGAKVVHGVSAIDMDESNEHVNSSTDVHGLSGGAALVGTTTAQTLTNKTLTAPTINGGSLNSVALGAGIEIDNPVLVLPTIADFTNAQHTHADASNGGELGGGAAFYFPAPVTSTSTHTLTGVEQTVNGMSITYTAPASWPTDAKGIIYHFTCWFNADSTINFGFQSDGVEVGTMMPFNSDDLMNIASMTLSWPGSLTTVGVSHTARVRVSGVAADTIRDRAFWMTLA